MLESFKFILMIYFVPLVSFMGGTIYTSAFPELGLVFNVSPTLIKFSLTIYFIGMIFGTIFAGLLSDIYGRLYILVFFLSLFCLSSLFCGLSLSILWFLVGRFFQGMASAAGPIIIISLVADHFEGAEYKKYISSVLMMVGIGPGLAPIIGSYVLHYFDWRGIFHFLTLTGLLSLGLVFSIGFKKKIIQPKLREALLAYLSFVKNPLFSQYCFIIGALYGAINAIIIISPYIFRLHYEWSIVEFAWVGLALAVGDSMGALLNELFSRKIGNKIIVLIGFFLSLMAFLMLFLIGLPTSGILFLLITTLFAIGSSLISACLTTAAVKLTPQFTGISSSLVYLAKFTICSVVLICVLILPNSLLTINLFILTALFISFFGYVYIRKSL